MRVPGPFTGVHPVIWDLLNTVPEPETDSRLKVYEV